MLYGTRRSFGLARSDGHRRGQGLAGSARSQLLRFSAVRFSHRGLHQRLIERQPRSQE